MTAHFFVVMCSAHAHAAQLVLRQSCGLHAEDSDREWGGVVCCQVHNVHNGKETLQEEVGLDTCGIPAPQTRWG